MAVASSWYQLAYYCAPPWGFYSRISFGRSTPFCGHNDQRHVNVDVHHIYHSFKQSSPFQGQKFLYPHWPYKRCSTVFYCNSLLFWKTSGEIKHVHGTLIEGSEIKSPFTSSNFFAISSQRSLKLWLYYFLTFDIYKYTVEDQKNVMTSSTFSL